MARRDRYSATQQKILSILIDEKPHPTAELETCLPTPGANSIRAHISIMRKILHKVDRDIITRRFKGDNYYQLIYLPYPFYINNSTQSGKEESKR